MTEMNMNELNGVAGGSGNIESADIPDTYTVVAGDNLSKIASRFKTTWQALYALNQEMIERDARSHGVTEHFENFIYPGQKLKLK